MYSEILAHKVELTGGFWLGKTEVTQAAWIRAMSNNPSRFRGDHQPVENVTWQEATNFCTGIGGRLPTEAEWEYAARANSTGQRYGTLDQIAWYVGNNQGQTQDVKSKAPNAWGLYDMLGNVWEWVADWESDIYYSKSPTRDPRGPSSCLGRVLRGGSWGDIDPANIRVSRRNASNVDSRLDLVGFRCAGG